MREIVFAENEFYHIYNRGVDKRNIIQDSHDLNRFMMGLEQFNNKEIVGSLSRGHRVSTGERLVKIIAYCVNQNHFHLILEQISEKGIEKFLHKLSMGYSKYFNARNKRTGSLFQGRFGAKIIESNEYLLHLSAYVNLNHLAHGRGHPVSTLFKTSWEEYVPKGKKEATYCDTDVILGQFKNREEYQEFAQKSLKEIIENKKILDELFEAGIEPIKS